MFRKLKSRMVEYSIDQKRIAEIIKKSESYVTSRMSAKQPFTIDDIYAICKPLEIPLDAIALYFPKGGRP